MSAFVRNTTNNASSFANYPTDEFTSCLRPDLDRILLVRYDQAPDYDTLCSTLHHERSSLFFIDECMEALRNDPWVFKRLDSHFFSSLSQKVWQQNKSVKLLQAFQALAEAINNVNRAMQYSDDPRSPAHVRKTHSISFIIHVYSNNSSSSI